MNIEHLKLFVRVASTLNISSAGNELGLSAAVSSAHINKLEQELGIRLLHRTTRNVSLTEEGKVFLPHAEEVLVGIEAAKASVGVGNASPMGTLRITAPASFGRQHLVPALAEFLKRYPLINIDLSMSDTIVDMVEGGFDIAIRNAELKDSSLIASKLAEDKRIICAAPSYIEEFGMPKTLEDLKAHNCVNLRSFDTWALKLEGKTVNIKTHSKLRTDNGEAMRDASVQGLGLSINSTWNVYKHLKSGELVKVLEDYPLASDTAIWAVYPSSRLLAPKVRVLIDFLKDWYGTPPYWDTE